MATLILSSMNTRLSNADLLDNAKLKMAKSSRATVYAELLGLAASNHEAWFTIEHEGPDSGQPGTTKHELLLQSRHDIISNVRAFSELEQWNMGIAARYLSFSNPYSCCLFFIRIPRMHTTSNLELQSTKHISATNNDKLWAVYDDVLPLVETAVDFSSLTYFDDTHQAQRTHNHISLDDDTKKERRLYIPDSTATAKDE